MRDNEEPLKGRRGEQDYKDEIKNDKKNLPKVIENINNILSYLKIY